MERAPQAGPSRLPSARAVLMALAVAWAVFAAFTEADRALASLDARQGNLSGAMGWREGMDAVVRFRSFVDAARPHLPAGSIVVFTTPDYGNGELFFRSRWAAYLLPEVEVIPLYDPAAAAVGEYLLGYRQPVDHPRTELLQRLPDGWLYRIRPPAP